MARTIEATMAPASPLLDDDLAAQAFADSAAAYLARVGFNPECSKVWRRVLRSESPWLTPLKLYCGISSLNLERWRPSAQRERGRELTEAMMQLDDELRRVRRAAWTTRDRTFIQQLNAITERVASLKADVARTRARPESPRSLVGCIEQLRDEASMALAGLRPMASLPGYEKQCEAVIAQLAQDVEAFDATLGALRAVEASIENPAHQRAVLWGCVDDELKRLRWTDVAIVQLIRDAEHVFSKGPPEAHALFDGQDDACGVLRDLRRKRAAICARLEKRRVAISGTRGAL